MLFEFDLVLLTEDRYINTQQNSAYVKNIFLEDAILINAFEKYHLRIVRKSWSDPQFDWNKTKYILFRTTWDYFDRYDAFYTWLHQSFIKNKCINAFETIIWNLDKHYLLDLHSKKIPIVETYIAEMKSTKTLKEISIENNWHHLVIKPAISGAARNTYKITFEQIQEYENIFQSLIQKEAILIQPFQEKILTKGEITFVLIAGKYTHAILKKAKEGDFRVQDDFGGTIHPYFPSTLEIEFAEFVVQTILPIPFYARVDFIWDQHDRLVVSELELIEPELWFRKNKIAAQLLSEAISKLF